MEIWQHECMHWQISELWLLNKIVSEEKCSDSSSVHMLLIFNMLELNSEDSMWPHTVQTGLYQGKIIIDANYDNLAQCFNTRNMSYNHFMA